VAPKRNEELLRGALKSVWLENRSVIFERIDLIGRAAEAVRSGSLTVEERERAVAATHKLAGTLGMFGFCEGSKCAEQIEAALSEAGEGDSLLPTLISRLREMAECFEYK